MVVAGRRVFCGARGAGPAWDTGCPGRGEVAGDTRAGRGRGTTGVWAEAAPERRGNMGRPGWGGADPGEGL